jgi:predicted ATPase
MLSAASVIGNAFDLSTVASVTGMDRPQVMDVVDAALESRVIVPLAEHLDGYRFAHELIRDTLYAELRGQERQRLHQMVAERFAEQVEQGGRPLRGDAREIAQHFYRALPEADAGQAVKWLTRAADECEKEAAYSDAVRFYRSALDAGRLLKEPDPEGRTVLESGLVRATESMRAAKANV